MMTQHPTVRVVFFGVGVVASLLFLALALLPAVGRADISASATLSSASFSVDDMAQLIITVNGTRSADIEIPETDTSAFEIFQRGRSSQINMINGQFSSTITFTCIIRAYKPGSYSIPPITITADNTTRTTEEIPFEVTSSSRPGRSSGTAASPPSPTMQDTKGQTAFITLVNGKAKSYIGEITPVEVKAYFRQGLRANLNSAPILVGDGLVMPQLHDQPVQTQEMVGGTTYSVLTWQTSISNIKEGKHTIHLELDATLLIPQRRMSTSIFGQRAPLDDDFFDSVFGGYKEKPIKAVSDDMVFDILPLPEAGKPDNFTGAIGDFSFKVSAAPQKAETGEPLTLTMNVSGTGNFDRVEAPVFPDSADWKTYAPSATFQPQGSGISAGEKVFEQAIVARNSSMTQIPSLSFSYFDPQKNRYITRESAPVPVTITDKAAAAPVSVAPPAPVPAPTAAAPPQPQLQPLSAEQGEQPETIAGLAPLHLEAGNPVASIDPLYRKPLFPALMALCCVTLLVLAGRMMYLMREKSRPEDSRKRQLLKALQENYAEVDKALAKENSAAFPAACRSAIQQHLGTLWQCRPSAITRADIAGRLPEATQLLEIFTVAEQAAYSGYQLNRETMSHYASTLKEELEKLS